MIKVYLLLRNNKQSGPYSLEEIAAQKLKPLDLVWIEGKSAAWKYASEIAELMPYLPESAQPGTSTIRQGEHDAYLPKPTPAGVTDQPLKKVHVSLPANASVKKRTQTEQAEPRVAAVIPDPVPAVETLPLERKTAEPAFPKDKLVTKYSSSLKEKEEEYTEWMYKSKTRKNTLAPEWIGGIAVIVLLMMGSAAYYLKNKSSDKVEITQSTPADARAVEEVTSTEPQPEMPMTPSPVQDMPASSSPLQEPIAPPVSTGARVESQKSLASVKSDATKQTVVGKSANKSKIPVASENPVVVAKEEVKSPVPAPVEPVAAATPKTSKTSTPEAEPAKQKKTFSEKVDGFFNKVIRAKKVEPGLPAGSPEPAATEGERKAVRRGETTASESETTKKDLSAGIQVTTIEPTNTWMQGVHGLKMKVENKNDVKVSNAAVEVRYLNEQNAVIEKKTIRLASIAPGRQITMDIPDHRLADHATATLVSAGN